MTYEEIQKSVEASHQRMDRFEKSLEVFRDAMDQEGREWRERTARAEARFEKSIQEVQDTQLVQVQLMDRREREWNERFTTLADVVARNADETAALREAVRSHENGLV